MRVRQKIARVYAFATYAATMGSIIVIEAIGHSCAAQVVPQIAGGLDPQVAIPGLVPVMQTIATGAGGSILAYKGGHAYHRGESFLPHVYAGAGGTMLIYGFPWLARKFGAAI